jgi:hypothetical protein
MSSIREQISSKPWIGWAIAGVLFVAAVYLYISRSSRNDVQYGQEAMTKMVTVKFTDTGDELVMPRGRFEKMLRGSVTGTLDPSKGLINPKTNQPTGFLFNKSDWDETIQRINTERKEFGTIGDAAPVAPPPAK